MKGNIFLPRLRQTSIRWKPELKKQVEHVLVERDMSLQSAIDEALELWLASSGESHTSHSAPPTLAPADPPTNLQSAPGETPKVWENALDRVEQKLDSLLSIFSPQVDLKDDAQGSRYLREKLAHRRAVERLFRRIIEAGQHAQASSNPSNRLEKKTPRHPKAS